MACWLWQQQAAVGARVGGIPSFAAGGARLAGGSRQRQAAGQRESGRAAAQLSDVGCFLRVSGICTRLTCTLTITEGADRPHWAKGHTRRRRSGGNFTGVGGGLPRLSLCAAQGPSSPSKHP